jgi:hypothetical protein
MIATTIELFKDLTQFEYGSQFFDLHNDYDCTSMDFEGDMLKLTLRNKIAELELLFKNTTINNFKIEKDFREAHIINTFYRGRYVVEDSLLGIDSTGRAYVYLAFETGICLEFWTKEITLTPKPQNTAV